jgi:gas vesicle protein
VVERSEVIRSDIEQTRAQMGDTLDALGYKANVPARAKGWVGRKKDAVVGGCGSVVSKVSGATDSAVSRVTGVAPSTGQMQAGAGRVKDTAERNPLGLAVAGAAAGFLAGLFAPSTRVEDEKLGPMADQVKSQAADAGQEALLHGKQVAQSAAQSAVETAKEEGKQHGDELSSSLQEKAHEVAPSSQ